uniref:ZP domain-containing protein n=1 Tax=Amphiprion ocellaris TaxID=80972 RepID=A0AAQ6AHW9_AMPOC
MGHLFALGWLILLIAAINIEAKKKPSINTSTKCLGNVMRVDVGPLGGKLLEVGVVINNSAILLTPSLASQCGFSMKIDHLGNAMIYTSLQNCFAQNKDEAFTTAFQLRFHGSQLAEDEIYQMAETCHYTAWACREIICDHNYMEASECSRTQRGHVPVYMISGFMAHMSIKSFRMTTITFFTPAEKVMKVIDAQRSGHGIANTPKRLVLRSPKTSPETYTQNVAGVPMLVVKTSTVFEKKWLVTRIDAAAACPIQEGSVFFTADTITWYLPRRIDPLISFGQPKLLEVYMGIDGQRLDAAEIEARRYSLTVTDTYIISVIPIGAVGGYYKSHVQDGQYHISYTVEPMIEMFWTEDATHEGTRYKVFFPITTPLLPRPPQVTDRTIAAERVFKLELGYFCPDVALVNITFPSEVLSVTECRARGINVLEHMSPNSSYKVFTLEVPFTDPVVQQTSQEGATVYSLHLVFGLVVLDDFAPFSHAAYVQATLENIVPPSVSGGCDYQNFYVLVKYGTQGLNFQTAVGKQILTQSLAQQYGFAENGTHFSFVVPFFDPAVELSSIKSRLDVTLRNLETNTIIKEFSKPIFFPSAETLHCFPNGTMTALAVKLESVPGLNPSQLTLRDPTCGPTYSDERYAYFVFTGNSCGTTRKFLPNMMMYENEISLPDELGAKRASNSEEPEYELKVSCYYDINTTYAVAFQPRQRRNEPYAENAKGQLQVAMRLALDDSYSVFHRVEDYPITKYLQQPLYFEVELLTPASPEVSVELENCWATLDQDRTSRPRWNLIINGCANPVDQYQVIFHPVWTDARVQYPSHFKRFEVKMFAFAQDQEDLSRQLFVHCDVMICDARNPLGGVCNGQCMNPDNGNKGQRRAVSDEDKFNHVSLGPIRIS